MDRYDPIKEEQEDAMLRAITHLQMIRHTRESAEVFTGIDDVFFNRDSSGSEVVAVIELLLPNCGPLYISEYQNGKFWTIEMNSDHVGTLTECINLLIKTYVSEEKSV